MPEESLYTAKQAAAILGLKYTTFMARANAGVYKIERYGWSVMFNKQEIDKAAEHDNASEDLGQTAR